jgi:hypothetical protein
MSLRAAVSTFLSLKLVGLDVAGDYSISRPQAGEEKVGRFQELCSSLADNGFNFDSIRGDFL